jgi:curved DNA-binding protein CbpA
VLGAPRAATSAQLKAAYFQLAKRYHPDAGAPGEPPSMKKLRAEIFARIGEAWGVLGDERDRAEYLRQLESGADGEVDVAHILKAEEIFRRVTALARARQYQPALSTVEEAITLNPEEPEFGVWRAWLRFLLATDRETQRKASAAAIEKALERAPKCVAGYLFLAQMARNMGDMDSAERHLKRGLGAAPHHEELARELKFLELKRK